MQSLVENLSLKGYKVHFAKDKQEALKFSKTYIKDNISIGLGGSVSVDEIGLLKYLVECKNITLYNQYEEGISIQENISRRRKGLLTDLYITGTNALTKDGLLVNVDGSGNRVAAMMFGPKNVLLIVGKNKIVENLEEGFKRVLEVAAIKNIERMNTKATQMNKEAKYNLDNIANKFTYIKADEKNRIILILVDEDLGF